MPAAPAPAIRWRPRATSGRSSSRCGATIRRSASFPTKSAAARASGSSRSSSPKSRSRASRRKATCATRRSRVCAKTSLRREVVREKPMPSKESQKRSRQGQSRHRRRSRRPSARVKLSHPDRVYWADADVTKQQLADYYTSVWDHIAPHLVDRPLALLRCPEGVGGECFFQKHAAAGLTSERIHRKGQPRRGTDLHRRTSTGC